MTCGCNTNTGACATTTRGTTSAAREVFKPAVDIVETADAFTATADLPGVRDQDVDVRFEDGTLTIRATVPERLSASAERRPLLREYGVGDFERSFRLGEGIDVEKISADLKHGVLTLRLPKAEQVRPRKIEVRAS